MLFQRCCVVVKFSYLHNANQLAVFYLGVTVVWSIVSEFIQRSTATFMKQNISQSVEPVVQVMYRWSAFSMGKKRTGWHRSLLVIGEFLSETPDISHFLSDSISKSPSL